MQELHHLELAGPASHWVRRYLELRLGRGSAGRDAVCVEGSGLIEAARAHGAVFEVHLVCPDLLRGSRSQRTLERSCAGGIRTLLVSRKTFARLTTRDGPDGLASIAQLTPASLKDVPIASQACVLVLDRLELPGNIGSLVRCAGATGVAAVVCTGQMRLNHPLIVKSSVGAVFSVPVVAASAADTLVWLRTERFQIVGADPKAGVSYRDVAYGRRVALVLGSERSGLDAVWRSAADRLASIPMHGLVDSLNAGHAGAIFMFEVAHQHST